MAAAAYIAIVYAFHWRAHVRLSTARLERNPPRALPPALLGSRRIALVAGIVGAWLGARFGTRRVVKEMLAELPSSGQQDFAIQQLYRVSQAVDVMSVELERLAEGQRYAAKLLADRAGDRVPKSTERAPGVVTPH